MALFGRVCRQLYKCLTHFLPQRAAQEPEKLPEECEAFPANDSRRKLTLPEKSRRGEREEERGGDQDEEHTLEKIKMKKNGRVRQKKREKLSLENLMDGGPELREAGEEKRKTTVLLVEVKPLDPRSSVLKPIEGGIPMFPSVSEHAARFKLLPPVTNPHAHPQKPVFASEEELSPIQADHGEVVSLKPSSSRVCPLRRVPPRPTPAADELFSPRRRACLPERPPSRKPHPFPSSPSPQLVLVDIEEEENEYVEFTGKTFRDSLKRSKAEVKPGKMFAWMEEEEEEEREVQEEEWASEVEEIQGFEEDEDYPGEMGDFKVTQGYTSPSDIPKNEIQRDAGNVLEKCTRKLPLLLFTWRRKEEKKAVKEKERRERELLLERYRNDPKLKHLWINRHNRS